MSSRARLVRIALAFSIVGQAVGISTPAEAGNRSSVQTTLRAISPLSSPIAPPADPTPESSEPQVVESAAVVAGKTISLANGRVQLTTPPDTDIDCVQLAVRAVRRLQPGEAGVAFSFEITATDALKRQVSRFSNPLTFTLMLSGLVNWADPGDAARPWVG